MTPDTPPPKKPSTRYRSKRPFSPNYYSSSSDEDIPWAGDDTTVSTTPKSTVLTTKSATFLKRRQVGSRGAVGGTRARRAADNPLKARRRKAFGRDFSHRPSSEPNSVATGDGGSDDESLQGLVDLDGHAAPPSPAIAATNAATATVTAAASTCGFVDGVKVEGYRPPTLPPKAIKKREKELQRANAKKQHFRFNLPEYEAEKSTANLSRPKPKHRDRILHREQPANKPTHKPLCGPDRDFETRDVYEFDPKKREYRKVAKKFEVASPSTASGDVEVAQAKEQPVEEEEEEAAPPDLLTTLIQKFTDEGREGDFFFHGDTAFVPEPPRPPPEYHDKSMEEPLFRIRAPREPAQPQPQQQQPPSRQQSRQQRPGRPRPERERGGEGAGGAASGDRYEMVRRIRPRGADGGMRADAIPEEGEAPPPKPRRPRQPASSRQRPRQRPRPRFRGASSRGRSTRRVTPRQLSPQPVSPQPTPTPQPYSSAARPARSSVASASSVGAASQASPARSDTESPSPSALSPGFVGGAASASASASASTAALSVDEARLRDEFRERVAFGHTLDALANSQAAVADIEARVARMGTTKYKEERRRQQKWAPVFAKVDSRLTKETISSVQRKSLRPPPGMVRQAVARCERRRQQSKKQERKTKAKQQLKNKQKTAQGGGGPPKVPKLPPAAAAAAAREQKNADFALVDAMLKVARPDNSDISPRWRPHYERPVSDPTRWYDASQLYSFAHHPAPPTASAGRMFNRNGKRRILQLSEEERKEVEILDKFSKPPAISTHSCAIRGLPNMWQSGAVID